MNHVIRANHMISLITSSTTDPSAFHYLTLSVRCEELDAYIN